MKNRSFPSSHGALVLIPAVILTPDTSIVASRRLLLQPSSLTDKEHVKVQELQQVGHAAGELQEGESWNLSTGLELEELARMEMKKARGGGCSPRLIWTTYTPSASKSH